MAQTLLLWLLAYLGLLAAVGFVLYLARESTGRRWTNRTLLRTSSLVAFGAATVFWLVLAVAE